MRRADRLFLIIHALRGRRTAMLARQLAETLDVSLRTVYRDVADLQRSGVPIEGEAGIGYMLRKGADIPPLMFNAEELEALVVGTRFVRAFAGERLSAGAQAALLKIEAVLPPELRARCGSFAHFRAGVIGSHRSTAESSTVCTRRIGASRVAHRLSATNPAAAAYAKSSRCAWRSGAASGHSARGAACAPISAIFDRTASPHSRRPAKRSSKPTRAD